MLLDFLLSDEPDAPGEYSLVRCSRRAMATTFEVAIPVGAHPDPVAAAEDALDLIDQLEDQMTVFRDHSEVSRLNATVGRSAGAAACAASWSRPASASGEDAGSLFTIR